MSGMSMMPPIPEGAEIEMPCPRCGEEITVVAAPEPSLSLRQRLAKHRPKISVAVYAASMLSVVVLAFLAPLVGQAGVGAGFCVAWILMFLAWNLK